MVTIEKTTPTLDECLLNRGIHRFCSNGNSANLFFVCLSGKIFWRVVYPYLKWNGVLCVLCTSSSRRYIEPLVVMHASRIKRRWTNKPEEVDTVSEVKHRHGNSVASLECARVNKSIIYTIMRKENVQRKMYKRARKMYKLSCSKATKTQEICHYRHARKTSGLFFIVQHGRRL